MFNTKLTNDSVNKLKYLLFFMIPALFGQISEITNVSEATNATEKNITIPNNQETDHQVTSTDSNFLLTYLSVGTSMMVVIVAGLSCAAAYYYQKKNKKHNEQNQKMNKIQLEIQLESNIIKFAANGSWDDLVSKLKQAKDANLSISINQQDDKCFTVLHHAAKQGRHDLVEILIKEYGSNIHAIDADGNTALHLARNEKTFEAIEGLGADRFAANSKGETTIETFEKRIEQQANFLKK